MSLVMKQLLLFIVLCSLSSIAPATETVTYLHTDLAGTPISATDSGGNLLWRESYRPYGERLLNQPASSLKEQWFHGKIQDDTGLQYFGARYYDPVVGRFMGMDAVAFNEDNVHSFNRYCYGNNNPYRYLDPDGNIPVATLTLAIIGWTVGGAIMSGATNAAVQYIATGAVQWNGIGGVKDAMGDGAMFGPVFGSLSARTSALKTGAPVASEVSKDITLFRSTHGQAAEHAADAIKAGQPSVLTIARPGAPANRQASTGALDKVPGKHLDEYPPAMFKEGGSGASVRAINPRDNMSAGACIGNACRGLPDGAKVRIKVGD